MMKYVRSTLVLCLLWIGCSSTKPARDIDLHVPSPAAIIRVQSSYGDIQQVAVTIDAWQVNGEEKKPVEAFTTPLDLPVALGEASIRLRCAKGAPKIRLLLLNNAYEMLKSIESNEICITSAADGGYELKNCMRGLR